MEWLTLLLLVPAIVIPVVLLFGFAGCSFAPGVVPSTVLSPPVIVSARPVNDHEIRLEWTNPNSAAVHFEILRTPEGPVPVPEQLAQTHFYDTQLTPGETYSYRVRAISVSTGDPSEYSQAVTAVTWANAFTANLETATQVDASYDCIVQRFDPPRLARGGNLIAISAQAASNGALRILTVSLSGLSVQGDEFDSQPPVVAFPGPYSSASSIITIEAQYRVEPHKPLLVAFDVDNPGQTRFGTANHVTAYTKAGTAQQPVREAGVADRSGFTAHPNQVWMITSIDVATEWPGLP